MSRLLQPREAVAAGENARTASLERASERFLGLRMAFQDLFLKVSDGAVTEVHREELLNQLFFSFLNLHLGLILIPHPAVSPSLPFLCSKGGIKPFPGAFPLPKLGIFSCRNFPFSCFNLTSRMRLKTLFKGGFFFFFDEEFLFLPGNCYFEREMSTKRFLLFSISVHF